MKAIFQILLFQGIHHYHLWFGRNSKTGSRTGKLYSGGKKEEASGRSLLEFLSRVAAGRLTRIRASGIIVSRFLFGFLWLVLCWKQGPKLGSCSMAQVLTFLGCLWQGWGASLPGYCRCMGQRSVTIHGLAIVCLYMVSPFLKFLNRFWFVLFVSS